MTSRDLAASCSPASTKDPSPFGLAPRMSLLAARVAAPVDPASLAVFRIALGLSVGWFAVETLASPSLEADYIRPSIHLTYLGFDWVRPWPGAGMYVHFWLMLAAAIGVALGLVYRLSAVVTLLT